MQRASQKLPQIPHIENDKERDMCEKKTLEQHQKVLERTIMESPHQWLTIGMVMKSLEKINVESIEEFNNKDEEDFDYNLYYESGS